MTRSDTQHLAAIASAATLNDLPEPTLDALLTTSSATPDQKPGAPSAAPKGAVR